MWGSLLQEDRPGLGNTGPRVIGLLQRIHKFISIFIYLSLEGNRRTSSQRQANVYDKLHLQHRKMKLQVRPKRQ